MTINKINESLPTSTKIATLSDQVLEVSGKVEESAFNFNEIEELYSGTGLSRRYLRNVSLGHTLSTYGDWSVLKDETGYSIWKLSPSNYSYDTKNELYFDDKILFNAGEANSETATTFSGANGMVYVYDGSSYIDHTAESGTEGGTPFSLIDNTGEFLYLGSSSTFKGVKLEFNTRGSNYTNAVELYHSGAGWVGLSSTIDGLDDDTSNFESDGNITWGLTSATGSGWTQNTINGQTKYWARIKTTTVPITTAKVDYLIPADSVIGLLSLSSSEVLNEDWNWCTYESAIYVTIRNAGATAYEGDYYITSSSSNTNKQNFFIYNHEYLLNHLDSRFNYTSINLVALSVELQDLIDNLGNFKTIAVSGQTDIVATSATDTLTLSTGAGVILTTDPNTDTITISTTNTANSFKTFAVSGQSSVVADTTEDTITFATGAGITITTNAATDTVTFTGNPTANSFKTFAVSGQSSVVADTTEDTITFATGAGITITTNAATDTVTFVSQGTDSFRTIAVGGQTNIVADSSADTLTFATGAGITITTDAATDTITFAVPKEFSEKTIELKAVADTTALTSGSVMYFFIPTALNGMNLVDADAGVHTPSTGAGLPTIALYNVTDSQKILSTNITIDLNEKTSYTATTQPVINTNYDDVVTGDEYRIDVDVTGPGAQGLDVILVFRTP